MITKANIMKRKEEAIPLADRPKIFTSQAAKRKQIVEAMSHIGEEIEKIQTKVDNLSDDMQCLFAAKTKQWEVPYEEKHYSVEMLTDFEQAYDKVLSISESIDIRPIGEDPLNLKKQIEAIKDNVSKLLTYNQMDLFILKTKTWHFKTPSVEMLAAYEAAYDEVLAIPTILKRLKTVLPTDWTVAKYVGIKRDMFGNSIYQFKHRDGFSHEIDIEEHYSDEMLKGLARMLPKLANDKYDTDKYQDAAMQITAKVSLWPEENKISFYQEGRPSWSGNFYSQKMVSEMTAAFEKHLPQPYYKDGKLYMWIDGKFESVPYHNLIENNTDNNTDESSWIAPTIAIITAALIGSLAKPYQTSLQPITAPVTPEPIASTAKPSTKPIAALNAPQEKQ